MEGLGKYIQANHQFKREMERGGGKASKISAGVICIYIYIYIYICVCVCVCVILELITYLKGRWREREKVSEGLYRVYNETDFVSVDDTLVLVSFMRLFMRYT